MSRSPPVLIAQLATACWLAACSQEPPATTQIALQFATDLEPGTELTQVLVEVLEERGDDVHRQQWFDVRAACSARRGSGTVVLGSLLLARGESDVIRVRASGFTHDADGELREVLANRFDARFEGSEPLAFEWLLTRNCYQLDPACAEPTTCEPTTGRCVDIPLLNAQPALGSVSRAADCITASESGYAPLGSDFDAGAPQAGADAQQSDAGSTGEDDAPADSHAPETDDDAAVLDAPICTQPLAVCCDVDMLRSAEHCGGCGQACSALNITPACSDGACAGVCSEGFKDCNGDKRKDGCETDLNEPESCGECGQRCTYGRCAARSCEFDVTGIRTPETSMPIAGGTALGTAIPLTVGHRVVAAGVWADLLLPGVDVTLAIYKDSLRTPYDPTTLVAQTGPLKAVDNPLSGLAAVDGFIRVEAPLNVPFTVEKFTTYWLFVAVSADTRIGTYRAEAVAEWAQWSGAFSGFHESIDPFDYLDRQNLAIYLISTAE